MTTVDTEVLEAFESLGASHEAAAKAAAALYRRDSDVISLKSDVNLLKWMVSFNTAMTIGIFLKLFLHS